MEIVRMADAARQLIVELRCLDNPGAPGQHPDTWAAVHKLEVALIAADPLTDAILTPDELADAWRISVKTVRGWIEDGKLRAFDAARGSVPRWRITAQAAIEFARDRTARKRST
jgi:hypothetical protein